jgi:DNA-binding GntR family transcriptional regulator
MPDFYGEVGTRFVIESRQLIVTLGSTIIMNIRIPQKPSRAVKKVGEKRASPPVCETASESKKDHALRVIRALIMSGVFKGGAPITENMVMKQTGLSKMPVHEALAKLETEELVEVDSRRQTRVRVISALEVQSILGLRYALEGFVIAALIQKNCVDLSDLDVINDKMKTLALSMPENPSIEEKMAFVDLDVAFHVKLAELAGYEPARQFLTNLSIKIQVFATMALQTRATMNEVFREHLRIVKAIGSGDEVTAKDAMYHHLEKTAERCFDPHKHFFQVEIPKLLGQKTDPAPKKTASRSRKKLAQSTPVNPSK